LGSFTRTAIDDQADPMELKSSAREEAETLAQEQAENHRSFPANGHLSELRELAVPISSCIIVCGDDLEIL